jgi:hypothetical protein
MKDKPNKIKESAADYAAKIFTSKKDFHKEQAKLPIEEKIKILIELQKIVLKTQKQEPGERLRQVWKI